jgi:hypothetical protein
MPSMADSGKQAIKFIEEKKTVVSWNTTFKTSAVYSAVLYGWELYFCCWFHFETS